MTNEDMSTTEHSQGSRAQGNVNTSNEVDELARMSLWDQACASLGATPDKAIHVSKTSGRQSLLFSSVVEMKNYVNRVSGSSTSDEFWQFGQSRFA
jgi:hypothetical protein